MFKILLLLYFLCVLVYGNFGNNLFAYELISIELLPNNTRILNLYRELRGVQFNY